ncbi:MAG TPA: pyridoxal-5'-phosphate-dependent protein subunit beta, partial [Candidatus Limnocylindria bacterium]
MEHLGLATQFVDAAVYERTLSRFRENGILMPTFAQLADPFSVPPDALAGLAEVGPDAPDPRNLFRVHWHNGADRITRVPLPDHLLLTTELTGVEAPIVVALADRFPMIASHKVLAAYGCLA